MISIKERSKGFNVLKLQHQQIEDQDNSNFSGGEDDSQIQINNKNDQNEIDVPTNMNGSNHTEKLVEDLK